ncbi:GOLPH3/VPS74 family protein [Agrococcus jejuensis]|uniref:TIGR04222 domain-containing protein n=1 Tax=Agrococcus jejuensis TaxID=399736 RepID=A0A1G8DGX4_9MICO|nr:GPP34 family phosphoprotein [Agrococcus jejuensis]SDH56851.1 TIGR04222 domain-containing protein [Agrococcus jejuensis]
MDDDLLLVEDLLLVLLDDDGGHIHGEGMLYAILGGAVIVELAQRGLVRTDSGQTVEVVAGATPPADPLLRAAFDTIATKRRLVLTRIAEIGPSLREDVLDRLEARGLVERSRERVLGFIPVTRLRTLDTTHEDAVVARLRAVLVDGEQPDARTAALAALLWASDQLPALHARIPWTNDVASRALALQQGDWGASAVDVYVASVLAATVAVSTAVATAAATGKAPS